MHADEAKYLEKAFRAIKEAVEKGEGSTVWSASIISFFSDNYNFRSQVTVGVFDSLSTFP
jgi:hypothetical protein